MSHKKIMLLVFMGVIHLYASEEPKKIVLSPASLERVKAGRRGSHEVHKNPKIARKLAQSVRRNSQVEMAALVRRLSNSELRESSGGTTE